MESVVNKLVEIDKEASERLIQAQNQKQEIINTAKADAESIIVNYNSKVAERIAEMDKAEALKIKKEIEQAQVRKDVSMKSLEDTFDKQRIAIEDSIFKRIVGD